MQLLKWNVSCLTIKPIRIFLFKFIVYFQIVTVMRLDNNQYVRN